MVKCLLRTLQINTNADKRGFLRGLSRIYMKKRKEEAKNFKIIYLFVGLIALLFVPILGGMLFLGNFLSPQDKLENSDVIVVISGGETLERTAKGVKLFKDGLAPYLLFSGAARSGDVSNAKTMKRYALKQGISEDKIFIEEKSTSTYENALFSKEILDKNNFKKIILVTSPYHQRRAYMNFKYVLGNDFKIINYSSPDPDWHAENWWKNKDNAGITVEEFSRVLYLAITKNFKAQIR